MQVRAEEGKAASGIRLAGTGVELDWKHVVGYKSVASFLFAAAPPDLRSLFRLQLRGTPSNHRAHRTRSATTDATSRHTDQLGIDSGIDSNRSGQLGREQNADASRATLSGQPVGSQYDAWKAAGVPGEHVFLEEFTLGLACRTSEARFAAAQRSTGKPVVVTVCGQESAESLLRNIFIMSRLKGHDNIQQLLETWNVAGDPRFVMEDFGCPLTLILKPGWPVVYCQNIEDHRVGANFCVAVLQVTPLDGSLGGT